eukprot:c18998_g1_i1.p1 GENE.c18998_g1_i1~~c18998_g1_i1.p1  ORF type:complete len:278 (+),score=52.47 c18998_g1_i1:359-1192(+)
MIGPRKTILVDMLKPFLAAIFAAAQLGEYPSLMIALGIIMTMSGVVIAALEQVKSPKSKEIVIEVEMTAGIELAEECKQAAPDNSAQNPPDDSPPVLHHDARYWIKGYGYAAANVLFDVYGIFLTKQHGKSLTTWHINIIRFGFAGVFMLCLSLALQARRLLRSAPRGDGVDSDNSSLAPRHDGPPRYEWFDLIPPDLTHRKACLILGGIALVTFGSPALTNFAVFKLPVAVFLTLTSLGPVYSLPLIPLAEHRPLSARAVLGGVLAFAGVFPLVLG